LEISLSQACVGNRNRPCAFAAIVRTMYRRVILFCMWAVTATNSGAFDLQAHRGGRGLAPENTLAAFEQALALGVTTLETDLAMTRDGVLVLSHDPRLNPALTRGPDGRWLEGEGPAIFSLTHSELAQFDVGRLNPDSGYARQWPAQRPVDGARIPTLAELFALARDSAVRFNIETKLTPDTTRDGVGETPAAERFARAVIEETRRAGLERRVTVQSFDWRTLVAVRQLAPEIATACLTIQTANNDTVRPEADGASRWHAGLRLADHGGSVPRLAKAAGCGVWSPFWRNLTPALVEEAQALGLAVLPWTVNEPADLDRMVSLGVDGLITDYPDRARAVLAARGLPLPSAR
jgi:glycerophosphoryl diester phosphodiesterase